MVVKSKGQEHFGLEGAKGRRVLFRPKRHKVSDIGDLPMIVSYKDFDGSLCEREILDFSYSGLAFLGEFSEALRNGESLQEFRVLYGNDVLYSGPASISNQREQDSKLVIGCVIHESFLDMEQIFGLKEKARVEQELEEFQAQNSALLGSRFSPILKSLICDMRLFLERYKLKLDHFDASYKGLKSKREDWEKNVLESIEPEFSKFFHRQVLELFRETEKLELNGEERAVLRDYVQLHLHDLFEEAPVFYRSYHKPSGYAGDYVLMLTMYYPENHYQGDSLFGQVMNRMGCSFTASKAAISRIGYLTEKLVHELKGFKKESPFRLFSLASGPAKEVEDLFSHVEKEQNVEITLFDQDEDAMSYCHSRLSSKLAKDEISNVQLDYVNSSVKQLIKDRELIEGFPKYDAITSTGLFDYLHKRVAVRLLQNLVDMLEVGGCLLVGNLDTRTDTKFIFDNLLDWDMIYRGKDDLLDLAKELKGSLEYHIEAELTGYNLFLVIRKV